MEWAVWVASSDSEDDLTPEKDEESAPSNSGHQCPLNDIAQGSSISDARESMALASVNKAAANGNGWDPVKAKAGEKPTMREEELWEPAEKHQCNILTSEFEVSWEHNPRSFAVQAKKRHFTEDGLGQASKLAKKSEPPQKSQMPCESAECGESSSDPARRPLSASIQADQLEENYAAEESICCSHGKPLFQPPSQEVHTGEVKHSFLEFNSRPKNLLPLNQHISIQSRDRSYQSRDGSYQCPECKKSFVKAESLTQHRLTCYKVNLVYQCSECNTGFNSLSRLHKHWNEAHGPLDPFKCAECSMVFVNYDELARHRAGIHSRQRLHKCCGLTFSCNSCLNDHNFSDHVFKVK